MSNNDQALVGSTHPDFLPWVPLLERCICWGGVSPWWKSTITYSRLRPREILSSLSCGSSARGHPRMRHTHRAAAPSPRLIDRHHLNDAQSGRGPPSFKCPRRVRGSILEDARKVGITEPSSLVTLEAVKRPLCDVLVDHVLELLRHFSELWNCNGVQRRWELASEQVLCPAFLWLRNGRVPWRSSQSVLEFSCIGPKEKTHNGRSD